MRTIDALADLLFGAACPGCDAPGMGLCSSCREDVQLSAAQVRALPGELDVIAAGDYEPPFTRLITAFKDEGCWNLAGPLSGAMVSAVGQLSPDWLERDLLIVGVPSQQRATRQRGFDHTWALARKVAGASPRWRPGKVLKARKGADQARLEVDARWSNRQGTFTARPPKAGAGRDVLLIDDLVTTGATLCAAADALERAGWRVPGALTAASTPLLMDRVAQTAVQSNRRFRDSEQVHR